MLARPFSGDAGAEQKLAIGTGYQPAESVAGGPRGKPDFDLNGVVAAHERRAQRGSVHALSMSTINRLMKISAISRTSGEISMPPIDGRKRRIRPNTGSVAR